MQTKSEPEISPDTVVRALSARFPRWTIWWGKSTSHYWGLSRRSGGTLVYVEARSAQEFMQRAREMDSRHP
ncbi:MULTISPECIES: hypothetical protein [Microtetraspora]|uniref:Uncharacterized protein n=1 Tax=Microtetraspora glauca TaxID=1996 RepID=A0ABV3GD16_MICGL|nr:hypothetical protein [Microtetraspora sp. AC03309]MCC5578716.1 hypothetical protein [Microtetraspora sp. AC03309]